MTLYKDESHSELAPITGYSFAMALKRNAYDPGAPVATVDITPDVPNSKLTLVLSGAATANLIGRYSYDFKYTDSNGDTFTMFEGTFDFVRSITP